VVGKSELGKDKRMFQVKPSNAGFVKIVAEHFRDPETGRRFVDKSCPTFFVDEPLA
jgi:hypothetical protein